MKKFKRVMSVFIVVVVFSTMLFGCKIQGETYDDYSYGLTDEGIYENLEQYAIDVPNHKNLNLTCDDLLEWGTKMLQDSGREDIKTVDDYVYSYGEELLLGLGLAKKDIVEEGDLVSAILEFYVDGKKLDNFSPTLDTKAVSDGDSIVSSLIGHKMNDEYETQYTFPEDDKDFANKTATVKVAIKGIVSGSPIEDGFVEANLEKLSEYIDNVTDTESFLKELRPILAKSILSDYIRNWVIDSNWEVPEDLVECEMYRLKFRLNRIGYTYEEYLEETKTTDEEMREYCRILAKENVFAMTVYQTLETKLTEKDIKDYYGENYEYMKQAQGEPYLRLSVMRALVWGTVGNDVRVEGVPNKPNDTTKEPVATQPTPSEEK